MRNIIIRQIVGDPSRLNGFTLKILELLNDFGALSAFDLIRRTGKDTHYIHRYLYNLRSRGYVARNDNWKWYLINPLDDSIIYIIYKVERKKKESRKKVETFYDDSTLYKNEKINKTQQNEPKNFFPYNNPEYSESELAVINLILSHHEKTKQKFIYIKDQGELCELLNISPDILAASLRRLKQDGKCYLWRDKEYGAYQLRIKPEFLEELKDGKYHSYEEAVKATDKKPKLEEFVTSYDSLSDKRG